MEIRVVCIVKKAFLLWDYVCMIGRAVQVYICSLFISSLFLLSDCMCFFLTLLASLFSVRVWCSVVKSPNRHQSDMFTDAVRCVFVFTLGWACVTDPSPWGRGKRLLAPPTSGPWGLQSRADKLEPVFSPQDPDFTDPSNYMSSREHLIRPLPLGWW